MSITRGCLIGVFTFACLLQAGSALAQSEDERRAGFYKHQKQNLELETEREKGLRDYLKDQADWEDKRRDDMKADKKRKKAESPKEGGPEYKADRKEKLEDYLQMQKDRVAYDKQKKKFDAKNEKEQAKRDAWAMEEFGLDQKRPRFDYAKRNFSGGPKGSGSGASSGSGYSPTFPPPPAFDDFGEGYIPPPPPPQDFDPPESFPMPAPPMPFPPSGDFDNGFYPPPPPPPMDGDGFGF